MTAALPAVYLAHNASTAKLSAMSFNLLCPSAFERKLIAKPLIANVLLLVLYAAVTWFTAVHHEPWCDEADPWLLARDENFFNIVSRTGYIGSPALWYLFLVPFAKAGLPYFAMTAANLLIALATAAIIIFCAPFSFLLRALICFSYLFVYEYSVIARSYGISVLSIVALAALYHRQKRIGLLAAVLIAVLANTNVHGMLVAMSITAAYLLTNWRQKAKMLLPFLVSSLGILIGILQVRPPADGQFPPTVSFNILAHPVLNTFKGAFFPDPATSLDHGVCAPMFSASVLLIMKVLAFATIFLIVKRLWSNRFALLTFLFSYTGLFLLFAIKYFGSVRHWGFYLLVALYCLWIDDSREEKTATPRLDSVLSLALLLSLIYSSAVGIYACVIEYQRPFSAGEETVQVLRTLDLKNDPVVCSPNVGLTVLPYLPDLKLFYPNLNQFGTHALWNRPEKRVLTTDELCQIIDARFGKDKKLYLLTDKESPELAQRGYKLLYRNTQPPITSTETFVIYVRNQ